MQSKNIYHFSYREILRDFSAHIFDIFELFKVLSQSEERQIALAACVVLNGDSIIIMNEVAATRVRHHNDVLEFSPAGYQNVQI